MIALAKAHPYLPDSRSSIAIAPCECGQARNYRAHQPIWWRVLYPRRKTSAGRTNLAKGIKARHQKGIIGTHFDAPEACSQRDGDWPCDAVELAEAVLASDGHELAKRQIAKHGKDRYPNPVLQLYKVLDELRELCVELEKSRCSYVVRATQTVRSEYADVGLALYELGNKLGIDLIDEMLRLVEADERDFREHR